MYISYLLMTLGVTDMKTESGTECACTLRTTSVQTSTACSARVGSCRLQCRLQRFRCTALQAAERNCKQLPAVVRLKAIRRAIYFSYY